MPRRVVLLADPGHLVYKYREKMVHFADQSKRADKTTIPERVDGQTVGSKHMGAAGSVRGMQQEIAAVMCGGCASTSLQPFAGRAFPCFDAR